MEVCGGMDPCNGLRLLAMPAEILEHIWMCTQLDHCDVCRLAMSCSKFQHISNSNEVWKQKFGKRWPGILSRYHCLEQPVWKDEFMKRQEIGQTTRSLIGGMSRLYIQKEEVPKSGFQAMGPMNDPLTARLIIDGLMEIYHNKDRNKDLTEKYYAEKALCHVRQLHIQNEWQRFSELPVEQQHLEMGAVLISQWCQPTLDITESSVADQLDAIALHTLAEVACRHPSHPVTKWTQHQLMAAELAASVWTPLQCRQILECLNHVLFTELKYSGNNDDYYDPLNSYINVVLERRTGVPIMLCLVYAVVARRLGVRCEPVNFPTHFLLRWLEHPGLEDGQEYTYIDVFHRGQFQTELECSNLLDIPVVHTVMRGNCETASPMKVFERMARNLVNIGRQHGQMGDGLRCLRNFVELLVSICPYEVDTHILQARLYLHLNINLPEVIETLQALAEMEQEGNKPEALIRYLITTTRQRLAEQKAEPTPTEIVEKTRSENPEVEFSIGLIMKHKRYDYVCVVYGWDKECEATQATQEWILQMGVNNLPKKTFQPFYNVLVEDGSNRYAAQENLELASEPKVITHPEVGRYFREFCGTHYVANAERGSQYPDDLAATQRYTAGSYS